MIPHAIVITHNHVYHVHVYETNDLKFSASKFTKAWAKRCYIDQDQNGEYN